MPELVAPAVKAAKDLGQKVRLMFQDEARFGRMAKIRKCWTGDERPVAVNGYERQFTYVYGACSPQDGAYESMICEKMNTDNMGKFLEQVRTAHPDEQIVMVLDGASSHRAKDLIVPEGIHLIPLPPYSPQLNPQEHIWDEIREKAFPNRIFDDMSEVVAQLKSAVIRLKQLPQLVKSITNWPWIQKLNLNAN